MLKPQRKQETQTSKRNREPSDLHPKGKERFKALLKQSVNAATNPLKD